MPVAVKAQAVPPNVPPKAAPAPAKAIPTPTKIAPVAAPAPPKAQSVVQEPRVHTDDQKKVIGQIQRAITEKMFAR